MLVRDVLEFAISRITLAMNKGTISRQGRGWSFRCEKPQYLEPRSSDMARSLWVYTNEAHERVKFLKWTSLNTLSVPFANDKTRTSIRGTCTSYGCEKWQQAEPNSSNIACSRWIYTYQAHNMVNLLHLIMEYKQMVLSRLTRQDTS